MAVIGVGAENSIDEVTQYQMGSYVSSNEAICRIFSFPNHEIRPTVVDFAVHLENSQIVYFTTQTVLKCRVFTNIYSLPIDNDGRACRNISIQFPCAYPSAISPISGKSFHFPFPYFVIFILRYFPFHVESIISIRHVCA